MSLPARLEKLVNRLERWDALDGPGYQLEHGVSLTFLLAGRWSRRLQDLLHGVWLGHPLHPVLVEVPVGAWTAALVLDGWAASGRAGPGTAEAARVVVGIGVAGAVASAAAGVTDWQHAHDGARRVGMVHGALNTAALGLYGWSLADRSRGRDGRGRMTAAVGYALTVTSSYLGGVLSYRHGLGVDHADRSPEPRSFVPVARASELTDGQPLEVDADGAPVVLVSSQGTVYALGARCPHLAAPLGEGWLYRGELVCPWHGSRFDLPTGAVRQGPASAPLPCYDTRIEGDQVAVRRRAHWRSPTAATTAEEASR